MWYADIQRLKVFDTGRNEKWFVIFAEEMDKMGSSNCDTCAYNIYDEEDEGYYCEASMDEDDMVRLMEGQYKNCPKN